MEEEEDLDFLRIEEGAVASEVEAGVGSDMMSDMVVGVVRGREGEGKVSLVEVESGSSRRGELTSVGGL